MGLDASVSPTPSTTRSTDFGRYARETVAVAAARIVGFRRAAGMSRTVRENQLDGG